MERQPWGKKERKIESEILQKCTRCGIEFKGPLQDEPRCEECLKKEEKSTSLRICNMCGRQTYGPPKDEQPDFYCEICSRIPFRP
jgi:ribosomal protein L37E